MAQHDAAQGQWFNDVQKKLFSGNPVSGNLADTHVPREVVMILVGPSR